MNILKFLKKDKKGGVAEWFKAVVLRTTSF